jgi:hypothetical protein
MSQNSECNDFEEEVNDLKGQLEKLREDFEELNERLQGKKEHKMPSTDEVETRWHKSEIISRYRDGIDDIYDEINKRYQSFYELYLKEFERVYIIPLNECQDRVLKCSEKMTIEDLYECINLLSYNDYYKPIYGSGEHLFLSYVFFYGKGITNEIIR